MGNADKRAQRAREKSKASRRQAPSPAQIAQEKAKRRDCGECQACCTGMSIDALSKPAQTRCPNQCATGCAIYQTRPTECAGYLCMWRQGWGRTEDRPDKLGAVVDLTANRGLREVAGGSAVKRTVRLTMVGEAGAIPAHLRAAMREFLDVGEVVVLSYADRQVVYGPKCPNGLAFRKETLDEIDREIASRKTGEKSVKVTVIPQSDGFARVKFDADEDHKPWSLFALADNNPGALVFASELYKQRDGIETIDKLVAAGVSGKLAAYLYEVVLERDLTRLKDYIDRPGLKDWLVEQLS